MLTGRDSSIMDSGLLEMSSDVSLLPGSITKLYNHVSCMPESKKWSKFNANNEKSKCRVWISIKVKS